MRKLITGIDERGRSCLVEETDLVPAAVAGADAIRVARLFATDQSPPPPGPRSAGDLVEVQLAPGLLRWMVVEHAPHDAQAEPTVASVMHHTDAIDLVYVVDGTVTLVLDDGEHELVVGDCVSMPGIDHAWKPGPEGCRMLAVVIGTPPRE